MKKIFVLSFLFLSSILDFTSIKANNINVSQTAYLVEKNTGNHFIKIKFDLSWDNSWRTSSAPNNWDAAWLFIKYRVNGSEWKHATLDTTLSEFTITNNNGIPAEFKRVTNNKGIFIYRVEDGTGSNNWNGVKLSWNYGQDGVSDNDSIQIKVFAIEMAYVPQGAFHLGSSGNEWNHFYTYPTTTTTYQVTSEDAVNVGQTNGYLYYVPSIVAGDGIGPIPSSFPKGYNAFYCMKYEISQQQYAEFLNTLTTAQKTARFSDSYSTYYRYYIKQINGIYGCDGNNNNILNEANDGQNIACSNISWADGCAYADWSGMRPLTELEFEKACRGTQSPVANEYAWGTTNITQATGITNPGQDTEVASNSDANCIVSGSVVGPMRSGCFAKINSSREQSGASYYGIMELTGNLTERPVTIGNSTGRGFTGLQGDGVLEFTGNANITNWPGIDAYGSGWRGNMWGNNSNDLRLSDRYYAAITINQRSWEMGFRCCIGSIIP